MINKDSSSKNLLLFPEIGYVNASIPLPMQYLGSKARISNWIIEKIKNHFPSANIFIDLFGGTGSVSHCAIQNNFRLIANDVQPYSYTVLKSLFYEKRDGLRNLAETVSSWNENETLLSSGREYAYNLLEIESNYFNKRNTSWQDYKKFCENTPLIINNSEIDKLRIDKKWNLFLKYYTNTYFGVKQCLALDTLRQYSENLPPNLKTHLLAATISVMTYAVSSTTHLAQYLKPSSYSTMINLINKRNVDIIDSVSKRLLDLEFYNLPICPTEIFNLDYSDALNKINLTNDCIIYVDPPYFKEHYSRYYHILDTFLLYDFPYLTYNPRLRRITVGKYRDKRYVSEFGLKAEAEKAFRKLFIIIYQKKSNLILSYANTSLVSMESIVQIAENVGFKVAMEEKKLLHSGQGQPRNKNVIEYLFLLEGK